MEIISCCGTVCSDCDSFPNECAGCPASSGKPYWTKHVGIETCPIYACCVNENEYDHCGSCSKLPCSKYSDLVDPSMTDEEHEQSIQDRVNVLNKL